MTFRDEMTVREARDLLRELAQGDGACCPVCTQMTKVRRRNLTSVAARAVGALYREHRREFGHLPTVARKHLPDVAHQGGYLALGVHWGLIVPSHIRRTDRGKAGYWRVTELGELWLHDLASVPKYVNLFNGRRVGLAFGEPVSAADALGTHFDLLPVVAPAPVDPDADVFSEAAA